MSGSSSRRMTRLRWKRFSDQRVIRSWIGLISDGRERGREDHRTCAVAVAVIVQDDLLEAVRSGGEHRRHPSVISAKFADSADHHLGVVEPVAHQCDQQPELQAEEGEAERQPGEDLERQLRAEGADRQLRHVAGQCERQERANSPRSRTAPI